MKVTKYVQNWFERGDDDLKAAEILIKEGGPPNTVCFHGQQAAEKYLKGFLAHNEKHKRKVHDLEALLGACIKIVSGFEILKEDALFLTQFYTESRYPDDYIEFSRADAERAIESAIRIKNFVLDKTPKE